eukprot:1604605-Pyramimonas_sp.AAC.1
MKHTWPGRPRSDRAPEEAVGENVALGKNMQERDGKWPASTWGRRTRNACDSNDRERKQD